MVKIIFWINLLIFGFLLIIFGCFKGKVICFMGVFVSKVFILIVFVEFLLLKLILEIKFFLGIMVKLFCN